MNSTWTSDAPMAGRSATGAAAYEYLADLFLNENAAPTQAVTPTPGQGDCRSVERVPPREARAAANREIVGLIVGHLPILAAPWVTQYARHAAIREGGPCGLVRARVGTLSVEVLGADAPPLRSNSLETALESLAAIAPRVLIRVDESAEMPLALHDEVDRVSILTGADEAAVIASYRTLKLLRHRVGADGTLPRVTIAILGATREKAVEAGTRLRAAATAFLRADLEIEVCEQRIGGAPGVELYRGEVRGDPERAIFDAVATLRRAMARGALLEAPKVLAAPSNPVCKEESPRTTQAPAARAVPPLAPASLAPPALTPGQEAIPARPAPATPSPSHSPISPSHDLAATIPGLRPLKARCPVIARDVTLAVDARGDLHLVACASASWDIDGAIAALQTAGAWATVNRAVLALTPDVNGRLADSRPHGAVTPHLLVPAGTDIRRLLDGDVRVHLTAPADGRSTVCIAVN